MTLHQFLDVGYGPDGDAELSTRLTRSDDPNRRSGDLEETALHVAVRRRRLTAVDILLAHGADIDAETKGGKTGYAHAIRRRFDEVVDFLTERRCDTALNAADEFAVAIVNGRIDEAKDIVKSNPGIVCTGNAEEDRLLADVAGRNPIDVVEFLIEAGANVSAPGLDGGAPLHQAAWFGQPANARILIDSKALLEDFDNDHQTSPLGWAVHGSRYSGGADERQDVYVELVRMLLQAGSNVHYPNDRQSDSYFQRLVADASADVRTVLLEHSRA